METTTNFTEVIKQLIADEYDARNIGEWQALFNWYDEVREAQNVGIGLKGHYTVADIKSLVIGAMTEIFKELETEIADAENQAQWENRYYNERDYGGRL
jgi:hypothetical protein